MSNERPAASGAAAQPKTARPAGAEPATDGSYPGQQFGIPEEGPGAVAGIGRRLGALIIDWLACLAISLALGRTHTQEQWITLALFGLETWLLTGLTSRTLGMAVLRLRVARLDGKPVGLVAALVRTVLLLIVVPALVLDKNLRGLHDKAANTIVLQR